MAQNRGKRSIRVVIAHRAPMCVEGLRALLGAVDDVEVVGTAADRPSAAPGHRRAGRRFLSLRRPARNEP
jgi:hypothetical protein